MRLRFGVDVPPQLLEGGSQLICVELSLRRGLSSTHNVAPVPSIILSPTTIKSMVSGTRNLQSWVLGPSACSLDPPKYVNQWSSCPWVLAFGVQVENRCTDLGHIRLFVCSFRFWGWRSCSNILASPTEDKKWSTTIHRAQSLSREKDSQHKSSYVRGQLRRLVCLVFHIVDDRKPCMTRVPKL